MMKQTWWNISLVLIIFLKNIQAKYKEVKARNAQLLKMLQEGESKYCYMFSNFSLKKKELLQSLNYLEAV